MATAGRIFRSTKSASVGPAQLTDVLAAMSVLAAAAFFVGMVLFLAAAPMANQLPYTADFPW
jgi:hypothetical protein